MYMCETCGGEIRQRYIFPIEIDLPNDNPATAILYYCHRGCVEWEEEICD